MPFAVENKSNGGAGKCKEKKGGRKEERKEERVQEWGELAILSANMAKQIDSL